jgi:hypothetical protein
MFKLGLREFSITVYYVGHLQVPDVHLIHVFRQFIFEARTKYLLCSSQTRYAVFFVNNELY